MKLRCGLPANLPEGPVPVHKGSPCIESLMISYASLKGIFKLVWPLLWVSWDLQFLPSLSFSTSSRFLTYGGTFFLHTKVTIRSAKSGISAAHALRLHIADQPSGPDSFNMLVCTCAQPRSTASHLPQSEDPPWTPHHRRTKTRFGPAPCRVPHMMQEGVRSPCMARCEVQGWDAGRRWHPALHLRGFRIIRSPASRSLFQLRSQDATSQAGVSVSGLRALYFCCHHW